MISTVLSASSAEVNMYTSVRSRRRSSPGNLRLSALKWLDMVAPLVVMARIGGRDGMTGAAAISCCGTLRVACAPGRLGGRGSGAQEVEQGGVDLAGVCPGDGVRGAVDHDEVHVLDQARQ